LASLFGESLTDSVAFDYGCAFGTFLKKNCVEQGKKPAVCIGRDSRSSGERLKKAAIDGLCRAGIDVIDLGLVTTPGVSVMVKHLGCAGGVIVTASHNPVQYNGLKLLGADAMALLPEKAQQVKRHFFEKDFFEAEPSSRGSVTVNAETDSVHIGKIMEIADKQQIAARKYKVVLDSVNGAGGRVTKKLLAEFNCEVTAINDEPTGVFSHPPEPLAENLRDLCGAVRENQAQIGFAQDPDADRLAIADENGTYIGEEYTLALAAKYAFSQKTGSAATNLSTSRMIDDIAAASGGVVYRTAVGEVNVAAAMLKHNCIIGGEGNGGVIDLRVIPVRDSLVAIALILQLMTQTGKTISQLADEIGHYYMHKEKFTADTSQTERILDAAKTAFRDARLDTADGCRFDFADGWLHLRASNTEPVVRLIVEAKDKSCAKKYIDKISDISRRFLS